MPFRAWTSLTTVEFAGLDPESTIAVLPIAAVEQHGPHLPLGTDAAINAGLLAQLAPRVPVPATVLALPALPYGESLEHAGFPGTLTLRPETLLAVWTEVGVAVARAGLRKLLILNSHGGQGGLAETAALRLRVEQGMLAVVAHSYRLGPPDGLFDPTEMRYGLHGGAVETALMLAVQPDLVKMAAVRRFSSAEETLAVEMAELRACRGTNFAWAAQDLNPAGVTGDAAAATAAAGHTTLEAMAGRLAAVVADMVRFPLARLRPGPLDPTAPRNASTHAPAESAGPETDTCP